MTPPPIVPGPVLSRVLLVGQAPGAREPELRRPFAWTAGKTLFRWWESATGLDEAAVRERVYISAVCRCFPGKAKRGGGDRVPNRVEMAACRPWLEAEMALLQPRLVVPVGKLAISQFLEVNKLVDVVGTLHKAVSWQGHAFDALPLPHPSGASTWHRMMPGKGRTEQALRLLSRHPAVKSL